MSCEEKGYFCDEKERREGGSGCDVLGEKGESTGRESSPVIDWLVLGCRANPPVKMDYVIHKLRSMTLSS